MLRISGKNGENARRLVAAMLLTIVIGLGYAAALPASLEPRQNAVGSIRDGIDSTGIPPKIVEFALIGTILRCTIFASERSD